MDQSKQQVDNVQSSPSYDRTLPIHQDSKYSRGPWERLKQTRGENITFGFLHSGTSPENAAQPTLRNPWHWDSSLFPAGPSRRPIDVAACREEDRYGIAPESDAEAAAAMLRTNDDVADSSTQHSQSAVLAQVSQGRLI